MSKSKKTTDTKDVMREEYDFTGGVRGKYAARFAQGMNFVLLDPDVAAIFKDSKSVNAALRKVSGIVRKKPAVSALAVREKKPRYGK